MSAHVLAGPKGLLAMATAILLATAACGSGDGIGPEPGTEDARLRVTAAVAGTPVNRMVATVTAGDIATALVFNLQVSDGVATGTLRIPPGTQRTITLQAFESGGSITHEGSATIDVQSGQNPPVTIVMLPRSGQVPITATLALVSVIVSPSSTTLDVGQTRQYTAEIRGPDNVPVQGTVEWAVTNPAFAIVDQDGTVSALAEGTLTVVATYGGVAGTATLVVGGGSLPSVVTVAQARALPDETAVAVGEATLTADFRATNTTLWMQDGTAGIRVFLSGNSNTLALGQHVTVTGTRSTPSSGDVSVTVTEITVVSSGPAATPSVVTGADLYGGARQGQLVVVSGGLVQGFTAEAQPKPIVQFGGSSFVLDLQASGLPSSGFAVGQTLGLVTGVVGLHSSGVRIIPRNAADIVVGG